MTSRLCTTDRVRLMSLINSGAVVICQTDVINQKCSSAHSQGVVRCYWPCQWCSSSNFLNSSSNNGRSIGHLPQLISIEEKSQFRLEWVRFWYRLGHMNSSEANIILLCNTSSTLSLSKSKHSSIFDNNISLTTEHSEHRLYNLLPQKCDRLFIFSGLASF